MQVIEPRFLGCPLASLVPATTYYAIQPHNNVVSNTFVSVYVRSIFDAFP